MVTPADFYAAFPEFAPYGLAPGAITWWINFAACFLDQGIWGQPRASSNDPYTPYDYGVLFYAAHHVSIGMRSLGQVGPAATPGGNPIGAPGATQGITTNKTADKLSVAYDVGPIVEEAAGHWNSTSYGTRFVRLSRQFGCAPRYIAPAGGSDSVVAGWAGPGYPLPGVWWYS